MAKTPSEHPWDEENLRRQRRCVCCGEPLTVQWPGSRCSDMAGCRDRLDALHRTALRCWRGAEYELAAIRAAQVERELSTEIAKRTMLRARARWGGFDTSALGAEPGPQPDTDAKPSILDDARRIAAEVDTWPDWKKAGFLPVDDGEEG